MSKYKLEDLKVGAEFEDYDKTRTIVAVSKLLVVYSFIEKGIYKEDTTNIDNFFDGCYGELVRPTKKIAYVEYWSKSDFLVKQYCLKEVWNRVINANSTLKFIREFEIEVGEDGFPIEGGV